MNQIFIKYSFYALYTYAGVHACHDLYRVGGRVISKVKKYNAEKEARRAAMTPGERVAEDVAQIAESVRDQALGAQVS